MKQFTMLAVFVALTVFGFAQQAQAQERTVPNVRGLEAFTVQDKYMSLAGFLRWQYFEENNVWISREEADALVKPQVGATE
jgi:hypothetical protein